MSEAGPTAAKQAQEASQTTDGLISLNRARGFATVVIASLAFGAVGTAAENTFDTSVANAQTPGALPRHGAETPGQVQEYAKIILSNPGGDELTQTPSKGFVIHEKCESDSKKINRSVIYSKSEQSKPLGKCDLGSPVIVTEEPLLKDSWLNRKARRQKVLKATRKNNRFLFIEQQEGTPNSPPSTPAVTAPAQPEQPGDGGGVVPPPEDPYAPGNVGVDISWPQCATPDETPSGADFGIVGVNDGLGYSTNPCLGTEAANFPGDELNLYVNTAWNSSSSHIDPNSPRACATGDENCLAYNYGYNAGLYAYSAAYSQNATSATWWLDVESNATWSANTTQNVNSLQGEHDALIASGVTTVGAYSTTVQWGDITGGWQNNWPSWGATTWETAAEAQTYCTGHEFTGGPSKLMQFLPPGGIDHNVAC